MTYIKTSASGGGDMYRSTYDPNMDGKIASANLDTLLASMVGLGNVNNTSDAEKPISTAVQAALDLKATITALNLKAALADPTFTGVVTLPAPSAGTNTTQAATTAYAMAAAPNALYRTILNASGSHIAARAAGTYLLGQGTAMSVSGTGALAPVNLIYIDSGDFPTVNGLTPKLRIRATITVNNVAPTGNFTVGLYPITSGAGGTGLKIYTVGTVVTGSQATTVTTPAGSSATHVTGSDFALPANGLYALAVLTTATVAASSLVHVVALLQSRNA
jgi:hypothetical protein